MIGITGVATSGKDTLYLLLNTFLENKGIKTKKIALADELKNELNDFIQKTFQINLNKVSASEKELIRPIMVVYGKVKRNTSKGRYWIEKADLKIKTLEEDVLPIITDIRYNEYENDEFSWLKKENKGFLIHVTRIHKGKIIPPANIEEEKNDKTLKEISDYSLVWCTEENLDNLYKNYQENLKEIYEAYGRYTTNK